jgi:hypothetical protein
MKGRSNKLFYAVSKGKSEKSVGIYTNWQNCQREVTYVSGAKYSGYSTLDEAIEVLECNGVFAPVIYHQGETYDPTSFRQKFPCYGSTAPSTSRAEYVQDDIEDMGLIESPRRSLTFKLSLDALIEESSEDHVEVKHNITEPEVDDSSRSLDYVVSDVFQTLLNVYPSEGTEVIQTTNVCPNDDSVVHSSQTLVTQMDTNDEIIVATVSRDAQPSLKCTCNSLDLDLPVIMSSVNNVTKEMSLLRDELHELKSSKKNPGNNRPATPYDISIHRHI